MERELPVNSRGTLAATPGRSAARSMVSGLLHPGPIPGQHCLQQLHYQQRSFQRREQSVWGVERRERLGAFHVMPHSQLLQLKDHLRQQQAWLAGRIPLPHSKQQMLHFRHRHWPRSDHSSLSSPITKTELIVRQLPAYR